MILSLYSHILVRLLLRRPFLFLSCFSDSLTFSDGECSDPGGLFPLGFVLFAFLIAFLYFLVLLLPVGFPLLVHICVVQPSYLYPWSIVNLAAFADIRKLSQVNGILMTVQRSFYCPLFILVLRVLAGNVTKPW